MTPQNRCQQSLARTRHSRLWPKPLALLGLGFWASSLALVSPNAQGQSNDTAYCFSVQTATSIYASPSFGAITADSYTAGDTAYATTNPPTSAWFDDGTVDGNSFVEVAFYDGNIGWIPRFPEGSDVPLLVDITNCPNPVPNAAGYLVGGPGGGEYCFAVQTPVNVYSSPSYFAMTADTFAVGDTAYATTNPPNFMWIDDPNFVEGNSFVEVVIYGGNTGWLPRFKVGANLPVLVDLANCP